MERCPIAKQSKSSKPAGKTAKKVTKKAGKKVPAAKAVTRKKAAKAPVAGAPDVVAAQETLPNDGASQATTKPVRTSADASREFAVDVAKMVANTRCTDVKILDVRGLSPVTDYLVLATGSSGRQMRSAAQDTIEMGKEKNYRPLSSSGFEGEIWICVDFFDVLLHLFTAESRSYYDLEGLWGDAKRVEFDRNSMP